MTDCSFCCVIACVSAVAIIGAGGRFGSVRSQLHLHQVLVETNCYTLNKPELLVSAPWEKFDASGQLIHAPRLPAIAGIADGAGAMDTIGGRVIA
jgi:hypothetical protein